MSATRSVLSRLLISVISVIAAVVPSSPMFGEEGDRTGGPLDVPSTLSVEDAQVGRDKALDWLVASQNQDGSWASGAIEGLIDSGYSVASFYDWQYAAQALGCLALLRCPENAARQTALDRGLRWFSESRIPRRGSDWDNDTIWAALYGTLLGVTLADSPRYDADSPIREAALSRSRELLAILVVNQVPTGGWGYYDNPPYSRRPKWGTSFSTAMILPALQRASALGWIDDPSVLERAVGYVRRCQLPNGAYEYDLNPIPRAPTGEHINNVKGSLGRIQTCNWSLHAIGDDSVDLAKIRAGLEPFFQQHRFLDIARMRPVPHEAYYANAGYFYFFGHYHCAMVINELPEGEREAWHARLRPHVIKTQRTDGSSCDYLGQGYLVVAGTAFAALSLECGIPPSVVDGPDPLRSGR